jgi:hypothetical protein
MVFSSCGSYFLTLTIYLLLGKQLRVTHWSSGKNWIEIVDEKEVVFVVGDNETFKQAAIFHFMNCSRVKIFLRPYSLKVEWIFMPCKAHGREHYWKQFCTPLASWITISVMPLPLGFMLYFTNRELVHRCIHLTIGTYIHIFSMELRFSFPAFNWFQCLPHCWFLHNSRPLIHC